MSREACGAPPEFRAISWGLRASPAERGDDAMVARRLAEVMGVHHEYMHTDLSTAPVEEVLDRPIFCAEGRTDGLEVWRGLHDEGIKGIIRGDEGFGWVTVTSELGIRLSVDASPRASLAS